METGSLDLIITLVSIIGTVLAAFGFLHRELRRLDAKMEQKFDRMGQSFDEKLDRMSQSFDQKFEGIDQKFEGIDQKFERMSQSFDQKFERMGQRFDQKFERMGQRFDGLRTVLASVQVSVARIEGHLGIGFPTRGEQRAEDEPPERAA